MSWKCNNCKIFFENKPTYTTSCPNCKERLDFAEDNADGYKVYGTLTFVPDRCVWCAKKTHKHDFLVLDKPYPFSENGETDKIHKKCRKEQKTEDSKMLIWGYKLKEGQEDVV